LGVTLERDGRFSFAVDRSSRCRFRYTVTAIDAAGNASRSLRFTTR
jgi:hypothetical protein